MLVIGKLGRVERFAAKANDFGVQQYYRFWIDPNDASQQPITCYCARLLPTLEPYLGQPLIQDRPLVHVEGVYLKRIAYASKAGSQLAPAMWAALLRDQLSYLHSRTMQSDRVPEIHRRLLPGNGWSRCLRAQPSDHFSHLSILHGLISQNSNRTPTEPAT